MNLIYITVIGAGYVGTTTSVALAEMGHRVFVIDQDQNKIKSLKEGQLPFFEEGVEELLQEHLRKGSILVSDNFKEALSNSEVVFIAVGTPPLPNGRANLSSVEEVAGQIGKEIMNHKVIVIKSTVPVGTSERVERIIANQIKQRGLWISFDVVSNPEFLREGKALQDALFPERIVIGCKTEQAQTVMEKLYEGTDATVIFTTSRNAEMIKYTSNAFLATQISFINEIARLCDKLDVDVAEVAKGMGLDHRIGPLFLQAGLGYGGSCFPKDVKALCAMAEAESMTLSILNAVSDVNETQVTWFLDKVNEHLGDLNGKQIAILGLTFKPDTDDIREASSLKIIKQLIEKGAYITAYDPCGMEHVRKVYPHLNYAASSLEALNGADAVLIVTEWKEIINMDWSLAKEKLAQPYIFDGRNALSASTMEKLGFNYVGVGRR